MSSSTRSGSAAVEFAHGPLPSWVRTASPRASNLRNGPAPRKLYRPIRSPPTTLSKRNAQSPSWILQNAETGVSVSPVSRR